MSPEEFAAVVAAFRRGAHPGRNLYLWCGTRPRLLEIVGTNVPCVSALDLPGVAPVAGADAARRMLQDGLAQWLQSVGQSTPLRSIAIVHDLAVLAYYRVGLEAVYQWHASDRRMTILCAEPSPPLARGVASRKPRALQYDPLAGERFHRSLISVHNVVEDKHDGPSTH